MSRALACAEIECRCLQGFEVVIRFIASTRRCQTYHTAAQSICIPTFSIQVGKADIGTQFLRGRVE